MAGSYKRFRPFFDQEDPVAPISGMIAKLDRSPQYELTAAAVFRTGRQYLVVLVSGNSGWPDPGMGETIQIFCPRRADVDKALTGKDRQLLQRCQDVNWEVTQR